MSNTFSFTPESRQRVDQIIARYPEGRQASAVIPLLDLAQRQAGGWLPRAAIEHVAEVLAMAPMRVYEVASFYSMFNLKPVGRHLVQICRTTPCWLRGSDQLTRHCRQRFGTEAKEVTADGQFSWMEVECLGACVNAPVVQINDDFYEDLSVEKLDAILDECAHGRQPRPGSQIGRKGSEPVKA
ncbi:MAG TPA: NADH-quinone oxidoreductase subunit NuoE [Dongiaceae bacterium]|jgi:NADH-quinone oxidoreductase subunit E|nr:NADH-quinone oxidoreductase subunit NuoE [Dongiaceae bacterium]